MNRYIRYAIGCLSALLPLLPTACATDRADAAAEGKTVYPQMRFAVSEMTMHEDTRASDPMNPDEEKYVRTLAAFEFDNEGLHVNSESTYHFIDFVAGTIDGVECMDKNQFGVVESTLDGLAFESRSNGMICLVANLPEDRIRAFYRDCSEKSGSSYGRVTFDMFQDWNLRFEYKTVPSGVYDESVSGHIENMYMFGYYQGNIDASAPGMVSIDLGRLASRLDITVINETNRDVEKRFGYHFDQVCVGAYFFPMKKSIAPTNRQGLARTVICSGLNDPVENDHNHIVPETFPANGIHTRYFYVAAHSALNESQATKLHIFYNSRIVNDDEVGADVTSISIPLCNVHPLQAAEVTNGYSLSRNTRYHFTIRLKDSSATPASAAPAASAASISGVSVSAAPASLSWAYDDRPGEITVYLP